MDNLEAIYKKLNDPLFYKDAVKKRIAKIVLGASVIRVFEEDTKAALMDCLNKLDIHSLTLIKTEKEYDKWHIKQVNYVYNALLRKNKIKYRGELVGLKWGHATKIFNLFIGHLYHYSPYFNERSNIEAHKYFHIPLDSKVFSSLKKIGITVPSTIKSLNEIQYIEIQQILRRAAYKTGSDPLRFDDYAWAMY